MQSRVIIFVKGYYNNCMYKYFFALRHQYLSYCESYIYMENVLKYKHVNLIQNEEQFCFGLNEICGKGKHLKN